MSNLLAQQEWDLEECIVYAWEHSLRLEQSDFNVQLNEIDQKQAKHSRNPNLSGNGSLQWNFGRSLDPTTDAFSTETFFSNQYSLSAGMPIYTGFTIKNQLKQSGLNIDASNLDREQIKRDIAIDVASAYLNALFSQENVNNSKFALELSQEQLSQIDKLIEAGSRPRNERLDLVAQISANEQDFIANENSFTLAILSLKQLMNLDVEEDMVLEIPDEDAVTLFSDPDQLTYNEVYEKALQNQPNIEAGKIKLKSAELGVEIAKANGRPSLFLGGSLGSNYSNKGLQIDGFETSFIDTPVRIMDQDVNVQFPRTNAITSKSPYFSQLDNNLGYGFGLNLSVPIYDNYQTKASVERAELNALSVQNQNKQTEQLLRTAVQQALADAKTAKKSYEAAKRTNDARQAAFENAEKRFNLGAINTYDYISAKNSLDTSRIRSIIAKYDYIFRVKILDFYLGRPLTL